MYKYREQDSHRSNVMSSVYAVLQDLVKELAQNTDYVHYAAHELNLSLNNAENICPEVSKCFHNLEKVYTIFSNTMKLEGILIKD